MLTTKPVAFCHSVFIKDNKTSRPLSTIMILRLLILFFCCLANTQAEIYKWVDDAGRVHFSDTKNNTQQVETLSLKINSYEHVSFETLPQGSSILSRSVKLFSAQWCGYCKKAKRYFIAQGIPFIELDIDKNPAAKREYQALGGISVPIILLGEKRMNGFSIESFDRFYAARDQ